jgi:hypothetical protein
MSSSLSSQCPQCTVAAVLKKDLGHGTWALGIDSRTQRLCSRRVPQKKLNSDVAATQNVNSAKEANRLNNTPNVAENTISENLQPSKNMWILGQVLL